MGYEGPQNAQKEVFFKQKSPVVFTTYTMTQQCVLSCCLIVGQFYFVFGVDNLSWKNIVLKELEFIQRKKLFVEIENGS